MRDPDKPQQIIEAAVRVFARKGYYNSRVSDIAREAGIAAGTIYLYFKTKDEILVTLFRDNMADFVDTLLKAIADEPDAASKVRRLVSLHFRMLEENPDLAEVVQVELRQGQKFLRGASGQEIAAYFALIGSVLGQGVVEGRFRSGLPIKVAAVPSGGKKPTVIENGSYVTCGSLAYVRIITLRPACFRRPHARDSTVLEVPPV